MKTKIYKTKKKDGLYLYLKSELDFSSLPLEMQTIFGEPIYVMEFDISAKSKLAKQSIETVRKQLSTLGYFIQFPSETEQLSSITQPDYLHD